MDSLRFVQGGGLCRGPLVTPHEPFDVLPGALLLLAFMSLAAAPWGRAEEAAPVSVPKTASTATWRAGIAKAVITPEEPLWLAGYGHRTRPAEGKVHDLWVKVLVLEDASGARGAIVTTDLLGFTKEMYDRISKEIESRHRLDRAHMVLSSSHTHSGPVLSGALLPCYPLDAEQIRRIDAYTRRLEQAVVETVGRAIAALEPAALEAGEGKAAFAVNRRNNREADVAKHIAEGKELKGPVDHSVPVLLVRAPDHALRAIVFGYACHNTILDGYLWCGDHAGFAQLEIEKRHPGATAMFWAGCGADQNPLPRRALELAASYGTQLADAVDAVIERPARGLSPRLAAAIESIDLPFERTPSRKDLETFATSRDVIWQRWARMHLATLDAGGRLAESRAYPVQAWRLGDDQLWIILGGEVVVDFALRFKKETGPGTWIMAYANDVMAYIPSRRIQEEGGYEAGAMYVYGLPSTGWARDVEERVGTAVQRVVRIVTATEASSPSR